MAISSTITGVNRYVQGALTLLEEKIASSSATLDFAGSISSTYDTYVIKFINVLPATDGTNILMRMSTNGGTSYDSGANYGWTGYRYNASGASFDGAASGATSIDIDGCKNFDSIDNGATGGFSGTYTLFNPGSSVVYKAITGLATFTNNSGTAPQGVIVSGRYLSATAVNAFQFLMASGNIASGTIRVYGVSKIATTTDGNVPAIVANGRLTTESLVPISTSDRTAQSTIYYTPYQGNLISLYSGASWANYRFNELSLALSGLTSGKNYDVFIYNNAGALTLELSAAYSSDTARTDAIALQDGIYVKSGTPTRRLIGTIRTTGTTTTEDSGGIAGTTQVGGKRFVWNLYNQEPRENKVIDTTDSWSYTTNTIRQANGTAGNKVEFVCGLSAFIDALVIANIGVTQTSSIGAKAGVGIDSTSAFSGIVGIAFYSGVTGQTILPLVGSYRGYVGIGYHYISWNEKGGNGTGSLFVGDDGADSSQSGLVATIWN